MIPKKDVYFVIPAYNEAKKIGQVIQEIHSLGFKKIIVVDDCSSDTTAQIAEDLGCYVFRHSLNRGAGAATKTGFEAAKELGATYVITIDSDGQHDPKDSLKLLKYAEKYDVIIGSRLIKPKGMPLIRILYNRIGSIFTYFLYGIYVRDSQSGYKVFNRKALYRIQIKFDRYEFCSEIIHELKLKKLSFREIPIKVIYTTYSLSKGQHLLNGFRMVYKMIMRLFL